MKPSTISTSCWRNGTKSYADKTPNANEAISSKASLSPSCLYVFFCVQWVIFHSHWLLSFVCLRAALFLDLQNEGHTSKDGVYEYKNVKRWSKKVPGKRLFGRPKEAFRDVHSLEFYNVILSLVTGCAGKDIFKLDKIFFPINQGNMHWACAVAFMQQKRLQYFDSMGGDGMQYLSVLLRYLQDEHQDKKKEPLPDADDWELVPSSKDTPQQRNGTYDGTVQMPALPIRRTLLIVSSLHSTGYDCGVFTCMFADFISKDCPLVFDQRHITQCRERIAVSIINGQAVL